MYLILDSRPKKGLSSNDFTKTVTLRLRSIVPKRPTAHGLLRLTFGLIDRPEERDVCSGCVKVIDSSVVDSKRMTRL